MIKKVASKLELIDIKSVLWLFFSRILIIALGFMSSVVIVRAIGLEGVGSVAALASLLGIFSSIAHLGLPASNIYYMSRVAKKETHYHGPLARTEEKLIWYRKKLN